MRWGKIGVYKRCIAAGGDRLESSWLLILDFEDIYLYAFNFQAQFSSVALFLELRFSLPCCLPVANHSSINLLSPLFPFNSFCFMQYILHSFYIDKHPSIS